MPLLSARAVLFGFFLIFLAGAFLRIHASISTVVDVPLRSDAGAYFNYAYNLRHFGIYSSQPILQQEDSTRPASDAIRSPGYPLLLWWFADRLPNDKTILHITLLQALLGSMAIALVFILGRHLLPAGWALLPAFLVAISPQLIVSGTYVLTETLFTLLLLLALASFFYQSRWPQRYGLALVSGMLVGMASLTRPTMQYLLVFMLPVLWMLMPVHYRLRHLLLTLLGFALVMAPWFLRNLFSLGFSSDPTLMISTVIHGHYPNMIYNGIPETFGYPYRFDPQVQEFSQSLGSALSGILQRVQAGPWEYIHWYLLGKPVAFFGWADAVSKEGIFIYPVFKSPYYGYADSPFVLTRQFMQLTHDLWVVLAWLAVLLMILPVCRRFMGRGKESLPRILATFFLYFLAIHLIGFPLARYCVPLLPVIFLLATYMIYITTGLLADKRKGDKS